MTDPAAPPVPRADRRRHEAFWLLEHLAGRRVHDRLVGGAHARTLSRLAAAATEVEGRLEPVPTVTDMSPEVFVRDHLDPARPVRFKGAAQDWPAVEKWTPAFFADRFGDETIRLLRMAPDEIAQHDYAPIETSLREALARLDEGDAAYCRFLPVLMEHPDVKADLDMEWFRRFRGPGPEQENLQLFIGGAGTSTGTHTAISANFFVQVHGRKRWKLYHPAWSWAFRPPVERTLYFMSELDPDRPDATRFPEVANLTGYEVELEPGDILFNPPFWWHKVSNPTLSVGVGFRFMPLRSIWQSSRALTLLTLLAVDPPIFMSPRLGLDFTRIFTTRPFSRR